MLLSLTNHSYTVYVEIGSRSERKKTAKKWPEERSGEPVRIFFKCLSSPPTTSLSSRKTVPRVKISNVKMSKHAMKESVTRFIHTNTLTFTRTYSHTYTDIYIHKYSTRPLFVYLTRSMIPYRSNRFSLLECLRQTQGT